MLRFRDATAADLPAIVRLMADDGFGVQREVPAASADAALPAAYERAFAAIAALPGWSVILAEDEAGEPVGCGRRWKACASPPPIAGAAWARR